jgi:hypothetical protein
MPPYSRVVDGDGYMEEFYDRARQQSSNARHRPPHRPEPGRLAHRQQPPSGGFPRERSRPAVDGGYSGNHDVPSWLRTAPNPDDSLVSDSRLQAAFRGSGLGPPLTAGIAETTTKSFVAPFTGLLPHFARSTRGEAP